MQTIIRKSFPLLWLLLAACATQAPLTTVRFHEQVNTGLPAERMVTMEIPHTGLALAVNPYPTISEHNVVGAELVPTAGGAVVLVKFDAHGLVLLDEMTTRNRGQYIVVTVDGAPVAAWLVDRRLMLGQFVIEGDLTDEQAQKIVTDLNLIGRKNMAP